MSSGQLLNPPEIIGFLIHDKGIIRAPVSPGYCENSAFCTLFSFPGTVFPHISLLRFQLHCHFVLKAFPATHGRLASLLYSPCSTYQSPFVITSSTSHFLSGSYKIGMVSISFIPMSPVPNYPLVHNILGGLYLLTE